jgi:transcriptional regulator with XRE-family HTH domain
MSKTSGHSTNPLVILRQSRSLTQQALANLSGIGIRQIQKIEAGDILLDNITLKNAAALSGALGISIDQLYTACK